MRTNFASERLNDVFNYWKDTCWIYETLLRGLGINPADSRSAPHVRNWRSLEHLIFDNSVTELTPADWLMDRATCAAFDKLAPLNMFPFQFFNWSRKSRRSFHLPASLHRLFAMATYPNMTWHDVLLPFDSFMITLEEPLRVEESPDVWCAYDTILVSRLPEGIFSFRLLGQSLVGEDEKRFPEKTKARVEYLLGKNRNEKANRLLDNVSEKWRLSLGATPGWRAGAIPTRPGDKVLLEPLELATRVYIKDFSELEGGVEENLWRLEPLTWAAKIAVGWCLYLRSMSSSDMSWEKKEYKQYRPGKKGLTGVITQTDHICTILGYGRMDPSRYGLHEETDRAGSSFFVRPHWRRAHDRRPPGSPPSAPKSVTLPPLLIRKDLVPLFGIIGGTKTDVLSEE